MGPVEALKMAVRLETEAKDLYKKMSQEHPELSETFSFLITEEEKHRLLLEKKIQEMTKY